MFVYYVLRKLRRSLSSKINYSRFVYEYLKNMESLSYAYSKYIVLYIGIMYCSYDHLREKYSTYVCMYVVCGSFIGSFNLSEYI